jgi:glycolate oxidase iron-sulfur subunit
MHLVDQARARIERTFRRPWPERLLRSLLARVLPNPLLLRLALVGALLARPLRRLLPGRLKDLLALAPKSIPPPAAVDRPQVIPAEGRKRRRIALLSGCANPALRPEINEATARLLRRHGCEVVVARGAGCCGALSHHMGREREALAAVKANVAAWERAADDGGLDAIAVNASGCGTMVKDYGFLLREDPKWAEPAARVAALAKDISEIMLDLGLHAPRATAPLTIAYQSPCSMRHGQKLVDEPRRLLEACGFRVVEPADAHLCCGSAGTYNVLQPELARRLRDRKAASLERLGADAIATGNIGCLVQLRDATRLPVVHAVELLDWATGGPRPRELAGGPRP